MTMFCTIILAGFVTAISMSDAPNAVCFDAGLKSMIAERAEMGQVMQEDFSFVDLTPEIQEKITAELLASEYIAAKTNAAQLGFVNYHTGVTQDFNGDGLWYPMGTRGKVQHLYDPAMTRGEAALIGVKAGDN